MASPPQVIPSVPIDLLQGRPSPGLLPTEQLKNAAVKALSNKAVADPGLGYGPDEGYFPLRKNIGNWLTGFYQPTNPINAERICITGGASQNLSTILQVFTDPIQTRMAWLVEPTYHLGFRNFEDAGFSNRMRGIPEDEEGMDVNVLEQALELFEKKELEVNSVPSIAKATKPIRSYRKIYKHVIYCIPSFSNPSGTTMTKSRRESLIRVARKFDALIVCDDVYDFLVWDLQGEITGKREIIRTSPFQRLVDIDRTLDGGPSDVFGNVVSNGTFSKLIGPGCRVGWAEGTEKFAYGLSQVGGTISGGAPSQLMSTFVNELLESTILQEHITTVLIPQGRRRHLAMVSAIEKYLSSLGTSITPAPTSTSIAGGYCIWLKLPGSLGAAEVCKKAAETQNLTIGCGEIFEVPGNKSSKKDLYQRLRLCFMWEDEEKLVEGIRRLAIVITELSHGAN